MDGTLHQRVLADGWGQQSSGSVFCADSSLRYIYERPPRPSQQSSDRIKTTTGSHVDRGKNHFSNDTLFAGQHCQNESINSQRLYEGVDVFEAAIARACTRIRKEAASRPHSYRECSVCLSTNAYARIALCGHTFHPHCFLRWFRLNRSCPLCRGAVDKLELAQPIAVEDEFEALMAEIDHEPLDLVAQQGLRQEGGSEEPVVANSEDLMSFLESDFDTDMAFEALDELSASGTTTGFEQETDGDEEMDGASDEVVEIGGKHESQSYVMPLSQHYPPASTVPNYWHVLNQGIASCIMPPAPAIPLFVPIHQKMVHIAPKPETRTEHQQVRLISDEMTKESFAPNVLQQTPLHQHTNRAASSLTRVVSCRCTGGCRNGRCACVKEGGMCGTSCRCTSCKNPFLTVKATGANIEALFKDICFMHNVSKTRDMKRRLEEAVIVPCCEVTIKVVNCVHGFKCKPCNRNYAFSWCTGKLVDSERTPRNHCTICKRCCDHRDVHCSDCGRCYFAGVTASLPCPCKEASSHKKRREAAVTDKMEEAEEDAEGECCIM